MKEFRCEKCNKLLGRYRGCRELEIKCPRCGRVNYLREDASAATPGNNYPGGTPVVVSS